MKTSFVDVTKEQFRGAICTSYTGGASWFTCPAYPEGSLVYVGSPRDAHHAFDEQIPRVSVRFQYVKAGAR